MSQPLHENIEMANPETIPVGDPQHPPQTARNQESRGTSDFVDGSGHIFSMYLELATEEDKKMAENWKDDADGILIFTGLFSAAVASLISVSIQDLQQNPQDTSNFYLANMYQATINPNTSSSLPASPPPFSPPNYAVWVNALWFLSLVISITCALLATLLQQWARRYLKVTQPRYSPHRRARIRAFFAEGVDKFLLPWAVEALPTMLHLSLFLFFAGLSVFLWNVNLTILKVVLSWVGLCTALYGCITFIPVFRHDSPYHTPLSLPVWQFVTGILFLAFRALERITYKLWISYDFVSLETLCCFQRLAERYRKSLVLGMRKTAEETAFGSPSEIDTRAFVWTFDSLDEDHELERFFSGLPGFRSSTMVKDPLPDLTPDQQGKLLNALVGLSDRTSSSNLLPETVKIRRTFICGKAIGSVDISQAIRQVFSRLLFEEKYGQVQSAETARLVSGWDNGCDGETTMIIGAIVSSVVARAQRRDDLWFSMASHEMSVSESVLRNHATHRSNLSLAILIHVVRRQFNRLEEEHWPYYSFWRVLEAASKFDVLDTSPELQHEFCALWNQVTRGAGTVVAWYILRPIRKVYLTLHRHTDSAPTAFSASTDDEDDILDEPSSYPLCNISDHHPDSTTHTHDASASTAIPRTTLHDNGALVPPSSPDLPSPSVPTSPIHVDTNPTDASLLDGDTSVPASLHLPCQTATESVHDSTSPDPVAAAATRDNTSARTMAPTACETSTSTSSVLPHAAVSLQDNVDLLVHPGTPEIPSSAPPKLVLDDITATISPGTCPKPTSSPEPDTAKGSTKAGSSEDKDTIDPLSENCVIQENAAAILDLPLHALRQPPPPSDPNIAAVGPSQTE